MPWTAEQVVALAPDASSARSGKELAVPRKWKSLGATAACAWGTLQGSGRDPYQTSIDLSGPAFKCSCPSRKFPCKHGLGLFLILAQQPSAMTENNPPGWTTEWLAKRAEKDEKKIATAAASVTPPDLKTAVRVAASAEKRVVARESKVSGGLAELGIWLDDLVRSGFAVLPAKPHGYWEAAAARLVDAQAPGLARRLRALDGITASGEGWPARLLHEVSLLHLAREGWSRIATLPPPARADLRSAIGFTTSQEEVLSQAGVRDHWSIIGQRVEEEDLLRTQRTWLFGIESGRPALCLSFSANPNQPLDVTLVPGTALDAELVFFPGAWPLRALVKQRYGSPGFREPRFPHTTLADAHAFAAAALTANPWLERIPFALAAVTPARRARGWVVRDAAGDALPLDISEQKAWMLCALAGARPIALAGEWDGAELAPLGVWAEERFRRI